MPFRLLALLFSLLPSAASQTCSAAVIGACLGTLCPTNFVCTKSPDGCCASANVVTTTTAAPTVATTAATTTCVDLVNPSTGVSDCPGAAYLCNNAVYYTLMTQQCPKTCGRCTGTGGTGTGTTTCVDLLNPATGVSDCPGAAYLCNNPTYSTLMTQQCPATCGRCSTTGTGTGTGTGSTRCGMWVCLPSACVDRVNPTTGVSDCPSRAYLCSNALYYSVMTQQCPATCGRCASAGTATGLTTGTGTATRTAGCVDLINPRTGTSDCLFRTAYCNNAVYYDLMTQQCPATCGRCSAGRRRRR